MLHEWKNWGWKILSPHPTFHLRWQQKCVFSVKNLRYAEIKLIGVPVESWQITTFTLQFTASCLESILFFVFFWTYLAKTVKTWKDLWVRPHCVYGWDTVGCMGETPTPVWVRYQHLYGWDTSTVMDEQTGRHWNGVALNKNVSSV